MPKWCTYEILPCPICGDDDPDPCANVVMCMECDHESARQEGPEMYCFTGWAIDDWNAQAVQILAMQPMCVEVTNA